MVLSKIFVRCIFRKFHARFLTVCIFIFVNGRLSGSYFESIAKFHKFFVNSNPFAKIKSCKISDSTVLCNSICTKFMYTLLKFLRRMQILQKQQQRGTIHKLTSWLLEASAVASRMHTLSWRRRCSSMPPNLQKLSPYFCFFLFLTYRMYQVHTCFICF